MSVSKIIAREFILFYKTYFSPIKTITITRVNSKNKKILMSLDFKFISISEFYIKSGFAIQEFADNNLDYKQTIEEIFIEFKNDQINRVDLDFYDQWAGKMIYPSTFEERKKVLNIVNKLRKLS